MSNRNKFDFAEYIGCLPFILIACLLLPFFYPNFWSKVYELSMPVGVTLIIAIIIVGIIGILGANWNTSADNEAIKKRYPAIQKKYNKIIKAKSDLSFGKRISCKFGFHTYGNWEFAEVNSCVKFQLCEKCGKVELQETHTMGEWRYSKIDSCEQKQTCARCGKTNLQTGKHDFGNWQYERDNSCITKRTCKRCGENETAIDHSPWWGEWAFVQGSCQQVSICNRCGEKKYRQMDHKWSKYEYTSPTSCDWTRYCLRCFETQVVKASINNNDDDNIDVPKHRWGGWVHTSQYVQENTCTKCGFTKSRRVD